MGFMLEPNGENVKLTITAKEAFIATQNEDGSVTLEGPKDAWSGLAELLMGDFGTEEE